MKTLSIEIDDSLYNNLLEILKSYPKNKLKFHEVLEGESLTFEQAMEYTLSKNKMLYERLS